MNRDIYLISIPGLAIIVMDQISKSVISRTLGMYESIPVIKGFFDLVHVRNRGMAFGLMNKPSGDFSFYFLTAATFVAIGIVLFWFKGLKDEEKKMTFGFSLILGGAVGNLIDRLRFREVIDFLDFYIGHYHWPAFNVADSAITVGAFWVVVNMILGSKK